MGEKKVQGRKRQLLVDIRGNVLALMVHAADLQDRDALPLLLAECRDDLPTLLLLLADQGYRLEDLADLGTEYGLAIRIVEKTPDQTGFVVQAWRWIVERSIGWLGRYRRLSKDYEQGACYSEAWVYLASIRTMLRRLCARTPALAYRHKPRLQHPSAGAPVTVVL